MSAYDPKEYPRSSALFAGVSSAMRRHIENPFMPKEVSKEAPPEPRMSEPMRGFLMGNLRLGLSQGMDDFEIAGMVRKTPSELSSDNSKAVS